ncbi:hypothetical protein ACFSQJ_19300 [Croceitalea marina]|uniref:Uncharacterized protein n=1 Tax=Croceitalea marina TaxID=1775166 RepID=A0ABW5N2U4_9FLAO
MKIYYHITALGNIDKIKAQGLKSNDSGEIFVVDDINVVNSIAFNQLGIFEYGLFKIHEKGIKKVVKDNVAEHTSDNQFIIKQDVIKPQYLEFLGIEKKSLLMTTINENMRVSKALGMEDEEAFNDALRIVRRNAALNKMLDASHTDFDYEKWKALTSNQKGNNN